VITKSITGKSIVAFFFDVKNFSIFLGKTYVNRY